MQESPTAPSQLGRYRLVTTLGQGGMGTIWLAVAGGLGEFRKLLVVKELRWDLTRNRDFVAMFLDEAKVAARLNHANVVQTLEAGQEGDRYFLAMEFLDGQPLSDVLQRAIKDPQLSLGLRLRIVCGALAGLHYAHELREYDGTELRIVHRDVSPQNIFVTYDGQVKVVDFGIAKAADADDATDPGVFKGKFAYASPEQIKNQAIDRRADVFAVGVVLWEVVTLQRFARGQPTQESIDARLAGTEPRLVHVQPDIEPLLAEICDRAMHIDPAERFATADEFRIALEQYLLVSGERADTTSIAAAMQAAFASERTSMHKMIDAHLKDANLTESLVRRLRPLIVEDPNEHESTAVADLSELVHSTRGPLRVDGGPEDAREFRHELGRGNRARWLAAGVALGAAVLAVFWWAGRPAHQDDDDRAQAPAGAGPSAAAAIEAPKPAVDEAAPPSAALQPVIVEPAPTRAAQPQRLASAGEALRAAGLRSDAAVNVRAMPTSPAREHPATAPRRTTSAASAASPSTAITAGAAPSTTDGIGDDLRLLRKREKRKLDLEDPFQ